MTAFTNKHHHDCRRYVIFALVVFSITSMMTASITNNYKNDINNNSLLAFAIKKGKDNSPSSPSGSSTTSSADHVKTIKKPTDTATTTRYYDNRSCNQGQRQDIGFNRYNHYTCREYSHKRWWWCQRKIRRARRFRRSGGAAASHRNRQLQRHQSIQNVTKMKYYSRYMHSNRQV